MNDPKGQDSVFLWRLKEVKKKNKTVLEAFKLWTIFCFLP